MKKGIVYTLLIIVSLLSIFPIYWMFVMATNPNHVINSIPPVLIPGPEVMTNFENVLSNIPFFRNLLNSFFVASTITIGVIFLCSLAGFAFAKLQFPGRRSLFLIVLATMMIRLYWV